MINDPRNGNRGMWNVNRGPWNVTKETWNVIILPWNVNRGPVMSLVVCGM